MVLQIPATVAVCVRVWRASNMRSALSVLLLMPFHMPFQVLAQGQEGDLTLGLDVSAMAALDAQISTLREDIGLPSAAVQGDSYDDSYGELGCQPVARARHLADLMPQVPSRHADQVADLMLTLSRAQREAVANGTPLTDLCPNYDAALTLVQDIIGL